jgi:hypothetical protein
MKQRDKIFRGRVAYQRKADREIARYLKRCNITLSIDAPDSAPALVAEMDHHLAVTGRVKLIPFFRHRCTNYDAILEHVIQRWQVMTPDNLRFEVLHPKVRQLATAYFREINAAHLFYSPYAEGLTIDPASRPGPQTVDRRRPL